MSMCRCAPRACAAPQQRPQAVGGVALAALRRVGAQQRRERRDLDREVRARERPGAVALEPGARRPALGGARDRVQRVRAAVGVALRLGLGHRRLAEQVDRRRDAVLEQVLQDAERRLGVLADDEAVRHVAHAGGGGHAERAAARLRVAHLHRDSHGRRGRLQLAEEAGQVPRQVVEAAARRDDVDEAEQRRLELGVGGGEVHRPVVERLQRIARARQRRRQPSADVEQLALDGCVVDHGVRAYDGTLAAWTASRAC